LHFEFLFVGYLQVRHKSSFVYVLSEVGYDYTTESQRINIANYWR